MAGVATPPVILEGFGFSAGASYITTPIPFASQQPNPRASYTDGFPPQTVGNTATDPPDVRDFNGILYAATQNIAAFSAGQFFAFNSSISTQNSGYSIGAITLSADNTGLWINQTNGNTNNPDTAAAATSGWAPLARYGLTAVTGLTNANVTLTAPQAAKEIITLSGTLTGNVQIIFPPWEDQWLIANNTSGAFTITCKTASGTGVSVPQGVTTVIYGDGTNIDLVGSSISSNTGSVANTLALRDGSAGLTAASFNSTSDRRLKKNIRRIRGGSLLELFHGYTFDWRVPGRERSASLLAQEFQRACPEGVREIDGDLHIDPMAAIAVLTEELHATRAALRKLAKQVSRLAKK
jgi:hypothetical protein